MNSRLSIFAALFPALLIACPAEDLTSDVPAADIATTETADQNPCPNAWTKEAFEACSAAPTEADCKAAGGTWGRQGLTQVDSCGCPTGQGGCPCTSASDCLGRCIFIENPQGVDPSKSCAEVTSFTCTERHTTGCHCQITEGDGIVVLCVD